MHQSRHLSCMGLSQDSVMIEGIIFVGARLAGNLCWIKLSYHWRMEERKQCIHLRNSVCLCREEWFSTIISPEKKTSVGIQHKFYELFNDAGYSFDDPNLSLSPSLLLSLFFLIDLFIWPGNQTKD